MGRRRARCALENHREIRVVLKLRISGGRSVAMSYPSSIEMRWPTKVCHEISEIDRPIQV